LIVVDASAVCELLMRRPARQPCERGDEMRHGSADPPIHDYPARPLLDRVWAMRDNLTVYDAL